MWIRSQSKNSLGDYKFLSVCHNEIRVESNLDFEILGNYESNKRALEVLDEIEKYLSCDDKNITSGNGRVIIKNGVYQMPEK